MLGRTVRLGDDDPIAVERDIRVVECPLGAESAAGGDRVVNCSDRSPCRAPRLEAIGRHSRRTDEIAAIARRRRIDNHRNPRLAGRLD